MLMSMHVKIVRLDGQIRGGNRSGSQSRHAFVADGNSVGRRGSGGKIGSGSAGDTIYLACLSVKETIKASEIW